MNKLVIFGLLVASAMAIPTPDTNSGNLDCFGLEDSVLSCIAIKANTMLARAARSANLELIDGVAFVRDTPLERSGKSMKSETEVMNELPKDSSERALTLGTMLYDSIISFLKSHSLKVHFPEETIARTITEGRTKLTKTLKLAPVMIGLAVKLFALAPILFGGLSLLVFKAIFLGKLALIIAGVLLFQKLFSGASVPSVFGSNIFGKNSAPAPTTFYDAGGAQSWPATAVQQPGQSYYKRSFEDTSKTAQNLAYSAHVPSENTN
ncbi:uncharacterized protein Osi14 [Chelonus insularis]|uniref:uncharacterized protein Osi14 n=1 Tax=Chelonus insularis TaxID=460826 RepID=UPI00158DFD09|nr:uncharacterized protein LOC118073511 [Chelonus insularis]